MTLHILCLEGSQVSWPQIWKWSCHGSGKYFLYLFCITAVLNTKPYLNVLTFPIWEISLIYKKSFSFSNVYYVYVYVVPKWVSEWNSASIDISPWVMFLAPVLPGRHGTAVSLVLSSDVIFSNERMVGGGGCWCWGPLVSQLWTNPSHQDQSMHHTTLTQTGADFMKTNFYSL